MNHLHLSTNRMHYPKWQSIVLFLCIVCIPLVIISINAFFAFPMGDDYTYAVMGDKFSLWEFAKNEYSTWNGRFVSNVFIIQNPIRWNTLLIYRFIPLIFIVLLWISILFLLKSYIEDKWFKVFLSGVIAVIYLQGMPVISEGLYWYTGSVTYLLGLIFFHLFIAFLIVRQRGSTFLALSFMLLAMGSNEVLALWCVLVNVLAFIANKQFNWLIPLSLCVFGFIAMAPGNKVRMGFFEHTHDFFFCLKMTVLQVIRFTSYWFFSLTNFFFLAFVMVLQDFFKCKEQLHLLLPRSRQLILLFLLFLFASIFPAYWSTGLLGQHRTVNLSYALFLFTELLIIYRFSLNNRFTLKLRQDLKKFKLLVFTGLFASLLLTGNIGLVFHDIISKKSFHFSKQLTLRAEVLNKNADMKCLPAIKHAPKSLVNYELTSDPNNWQNTCYRDFYKLKKSPVLCE